MTKIERQIISDKVMEYQKAVTYYHQNGDLKSHEIVSEGLRAVRELAEALGINTSKSLPDEL